jgi:hypothetical protein
MAIDHSDDGGATADMTQIAAMAGPVRSNRVS